MIESQSISIPQVEEMPDNSRVWVFQASRDLSEEEQSFMAVNLKMFLAEWAAHGASLYASYEFRYDRFLIIYLDEERAGATGCSIDKLMNIIAAFEEKLAMSFRDRMQVVYRTPQGLAETNLNALAGLLEKGEISSETRVFNNLVPSKSALDNSWETSITNSWHAKFI